jgi:predicted nucleotidyltransferase
MIDNIDFLNIVKNKLANEFGHITDDLILFGSQINGERNKDSDYDLLIVLNCSYDWKLKDKIIESLIDIEIDNNIIIDIHLISTFEISHSLKGAEPIYQKAIKYGLHAA